MSEQAEIVRERAPAGASEHADVVVIGAGLSGIGAAYHLEKRCKGRSVVILEARHTIGGTWDLFRYPGIRSDSDMNTLGFAFHPWKDPKAIADGPAILSYLREIVDHYGIERRIRFGHKVLSADWSSADAKWTVRAEHDGEVRVFTCNFLFTCSGYYDYDGGYTPDFPGRASFQGQVVHPQAWPDGVEVDGKRVVVIGSGATAVTLVPALAKLGAHAIMLQRSPSYVVSLPSEDRLAERLRPHLPHWMFYKIVRWRNILLGIVLFKMARSRPQQTKARIQGAIRKYLGPDYDVATHFSPAYNPWDQRMCLVPDGDLFRALKSGKAEIVTDKIERFTETGLSLASGRTLDADIVVTATGLKLKLLGGMTVSVDGRPVDFGKTLSYRGLMYSGVPNLATSFGYTNASWTLKSELTCIYVCRLLNFMKRRRFDTVMPSPDPAIGSQPMLDFTSGYVQRSIDQLPRQGVKRPWRIYQNYLLDLISYRLSPLRDGTLKFGRRRQA